MERKVRKVRPPETMPRNRLRDQAGSCLFSDLQADCGADFLHQRVPKGLRQSGLQHFFTNSRAQASRYKHQTRIGCGDPSHHHRIRR
ncbi:hypothetical protein [Oenococcus oeni]|uniref:hypothetical protein n=1 Tax=Oenococcus oeni TaxID=1247 RepID=UPI0016473B9D|nr:hypothetical protein [Oenococcus oeni]